MESAVRKSRNIQNLLLEATIRHIEKYGIEKISLRKIAAECGVTHATAYKYYENKNALIGATVPYVLSHMYPYINRAIKRAPEEEAFVVLLKSYVRYMVKHPQYHYLLHADMSGQTSWPAYHALYRPPYYDHPYILTAQDYFAKCNIPENEYALLLPLLSAMVNGMILLINKKSLVYHGSYGDLIELLILGPLKLKPKTRRKSR
ncbi:hypothetical protein CE91St36_02370 [Christensenellaceae bacterium]|nr:hypothetical protein CE91St36_02370 [Christensenellaceae bacterium]BDF60088.1 hypothetical protein CE91St37_02380 [Christensenellaceae bacterium]